MAADPDLPGTNTGPELPGVLMSYAPGPFVYRLERVQLEYPEANGDVSPPLTLANRKIVGVIQRGAAQGAVEEGAQLIELIVMTEEELNGD